jgi:glycosyltransferase involved in cell wall biosynthesis
VTFAGPLENPHPDMAAFSVLSLPSRSDALPLVVMESMTLGVPVVAFDVGGVREVVGDTGILVPPEDVSGMADAILELLDDPDRRRALATMAQERVRQRFDVGQFQESVRGFVRTILPGPPQPASPRARP